MLYNETNDKTIAYIYLIDCIEAQDTLAPSYTEDGILVIGVYVFLLNNKKWKYKNL